MVDAKNRGKVIDATFEDDKKDINVEGILTETLIRLAALEKLLIKNKAFTQEEYIKEIELNVEKFKVALNDQVGKFNHKKGLKN